MPSKGNTAKQNQLQRINQETQQKEYQSRKKIYLLNKNSKEEDSSQDEKLKPQQTNPKKKIREQDLSQNQKLKFHKKI